MATVLPTSLLVSTDLPADAKSKFASIAERDALPISLRYKAMLVAVANPIGQRATWWCLPTDDLTNSGWIEVPFGATIVVTIDDWKPTSEYIINQPVVNGGRLYRSITAHTSSINFDDDEANWQSISGSGDSSSFIHIQDIESATWECVHNLESIGVSAVVTEAGGDEVIGYVDRAASTSSTLIIRFSQPISGRAFIRS